jgi:uncharacterized protein involved in exopolysaccharide biosynthesis
MSQPEWREDEEVSLLALGTTPLRNRRRILRWMAVGAVAAAALAFWRPPLYLASASFVPQGQNYATRSGLAGLGGQLGVSILLEISRSLLTSTLDF